MNLFQIVLRHLADANTGFQNEMVIDVEADDETACQRVADLNRPLGPDAPCEYIVRTITK